MTDTALASLTVSLASDSTFSPAALVPAFSPEVTAYTVSGDALISKAGVTALLSDSAGSLEYQVGSGAWKSLSSGSGSEAFGLSTGTTRLSLRVSSENGLRTRIYTIDAVVAASGSGSPAVLLPPSPVANSQYGYRVVMSADGSVLVTSGFGYGAAFVYEKNGGSWLLANTLKDTKGGATASDYFGAGLAISRDGSVIAVGANGQTDGGYAGAGRTYVFRRGGASWATALEDSPLSASNPDTNARFGTSLALSDDGKTLLVGADGNGQPYSKAYVFRGNGTGSWAFEAELSLATTGQHDQFGYSVALSPDGNAALVGAPGTNLVCPFVFLSGIWKRQTAFGRPGRFGRAVAVSAEGGFLYAFVGVDEETLPGAANTSGAVYVYKWNPSDDLNSIEIQSFTASNATANASFGWSISVTGDNSYLAVGAPCFSVSGEFVGAAYLFQNQSGTWTELAARTNLHPAVSDYFGSGVAVSQDGSSFAIGSENRDVGGKESAGAVFVF